MSFVTTCSCSRTTSKQRISYRSSAKCQSLLYIHVRSVAKHSERPWRRNLVAFLHSSNPDSLKGRVYERILIYSISLTTYTATSYAHWNETRREINQRFVSRTPFTRCALAYRHILSHSWPLIQKQTKVFAKVWPGAQRTNLCLNGNFWWMDL